jgi:hypothetical protein
MPRKPRTALTQDTVHLGPRIAHIRVFLREEFEGRSMSADLPSIVVHGVPIELIHKTITEALRKLAEER